MTDSIVETKGQRGAGALIAVTAVSVLLAIGLSVVAVRALNSRDAADDDRRAVQSASVSLVQAVLAYDYRDVDATLERVRELAGDPYRDRFVEGFPVFEETIKAQQAIGSVEINDIFVTDIDRGTAEAILVISISTTLGNPTAGEQPKPLPDEYVRLALNRDDGGDWRVIDFVPLQRSPLIPQAIAALDNEG